MNSRAVSRSDNITTDNMDAGKKERGFSFLLSHFFFLSTTSSRYFFLFSLLSVRPAIHPIHRGGGIHWLHQWTKSSECGRSTVAAQQVRVSVLPSASEQLDLRGPAASILLCLKTETQLTSETSWILKFNPLKPNDTYRGRTAPLTSKRCIL